MPVPNGLIASRDGRTLYIGTATFSCGNPIPSIPKGTLEPDKPFSIPIRKIEIRQMECLLMNGGTFTFQVVVVFGLLGLQGSLWA